MVRARGTTRPLAVRVALRREGLRYQGEVEAPGAPRRSLRAGDCHALAQALALATTLLLDGTDLGSEPLAAPPPAPRDEAPPARPETPPLTPTPALSEGRFAVTAAASAAALFLALPSPLLGARVGASVGTRGPGPRVELAVTFGEALRGSAPDAAFRQLAGVLEIAPWSFVAGAFRAAPLAFVEVGATWTRGEEAVTPLESTTPWTAAGAGLDVAVALGSGLRARVGAAAVAPFSRYRFVYAQPERLVYEAPALAARMHLGLEATMP